MFHHLRSLNGICMMIFVIRQWNFGEPTKSTNTCAKFMWGILYTGHWKTSWYTDQIGYTDPIVSSCWMSHLQSLSIHPWGTLKNPRKPPRKCVPWCPCPHLGNLQLLVPGGHPVTGSMERASADFRHQKAGFPWISHLIIIPKCGKPWQPPPSHLHWGWFIYPQMIGLLWGLPQEWNMKNLSKHQHLLGPQWKLVAKCPEQGEVAFWDHRQWQHLSMNLFRIIYLPVI